MTLEDVLQAKQALEAQGIPPSANKILRVLGSGSKHTVLKYLRALAPAPGLAPPVAAGAVDGTDLPPVLEAPRAPARELAADEGTLAVRAAAQALERAELDLGQAREDMHLAAAALATCNGVLFDGVRFGALDAQDPVRHALVEEARATTLYYRRCWQDFLRTQADLAQAERLYKRGQQEQWIATHRPELVAAMAEWAERLRTATSDHQHAHAKKEYASAQFAYQNGLAAAPWNGTHP